MAIKAKKRSTCRLCNSQNMELVVELQPIPPQELYLDSKEQARSVEKYPIDVFFCKNCCHVQQVDILEDDMLWQNYTYESGKAKGMDEHFRKFCTHVNNSTQYPPSSLVVDIGSNDGTLLQHFKNINFKVIGVDPAKNLADKATKDGILTIANIFDTQVTSHIIEKYGKAKIITAFNAFAHADNLNEIANGIQRLLDTDGTFYFEVQYLGDLIDKVLLGSIFHEHMSHHSVLPMKDFLLAHGLTLTDIKHSHVQHGAIIGTVKQSKSNPEIKPSVQAFIDSERKKALDSHDAIKSLNIKIKELKVKAALFRAKLHPTTKVYGFGAARSGQTLISQLGLEGLIQFIADDHPAKVGKYPAGDGIQIVPTDIWQSDNPDYTIILAWVHVAIIVKNNLRYLENNGRFIILTPEFEIIDKHNYTDFLNKHGYKIGDINE